MAMTFSTNGQDSDSPDQENPAGAERSGRGPNGTGLEELVRGEIGDLTLEFRRTVDRVGDRINTLVQKELQRALADVLLGGAPVPQLRHSARADEPVPIAAALVDTVSTDGPVNGHAAEPAVARELTVVESVSEDMPDPDEMPAPVVHGDQEAPRGNAEPTGENDSPLYADSPMYEGVVRLQVRASGCTCQSTQFVRAVSRMPELRVLRLVGKAGSGLELLVGLRQPMQLEAVLMEMDRVAGVRQTRASIGSRDGEGAGDGTGEQELAVWLVDAPTSHRDV